ncbi:hypothetical protein SH449x_000589 [Pirellulaceae bacterium SH449]
MTQRIVAEIHLRRVSSQRLPSQVCETRRETKGDGCFCSGQASGAQESDRLLCSVCDIGSPCCASRGGEVARKLPRYPEIPAILVGRLARDVNHPGVGAFLLCDAFTRCVRVASEIAASLIVVDSKGESATCFYKKFGFISLQNLPDRMFLPMQTAEKT